jgi:hypothetical protein
MAEQQDMNQVLQGMNQWPCEKCDETFNNQEEFDKHNSIHVEEVEGDKKQDLPDMAKGILGGLGGSQERK